MKMHKLCPLPEKDLDFVAQTAAPQFKDRKQLKQLMNDDPAFRKGLVGNQDLFERITAKRPSLDLEVSPLLFFEVLLRRAVVEMEKATHTVERTNSQRIPIFDAEETLIFLENEDALYYLIHLLASFVRCEAGTPADTDIDRLVKLGERAGNEEQRFQAQKRIADLCLFILGIFPEYLTYDYIYLFSKKIPPWRSELTRSMGDYEELGQRFYSLVAKQRLARTKGLTDILQFLAENFYQAKKPLNFISERYLQPI